MPHQPTVTKNYKNTQSEFDSYLGSCDVSVDPRAVRLSTSSGTQLLLLRFWLEQLHTAGSIYAVNTVK